MPNPHPTPLSQLNELRHIKNAETRLLASILCNRLDHLEHLLEQHLGTPEFDGETTRRLQHLADRSRGVSHWLRRIAEAAIAAGLLVGGGVLAKIAGF